MTMTRTPRLISHPAFKAAMAVLSILCAAPGGCGSSGSSGGGIDTGSAGSDNAAAVASNPQAPTALTDNLTIADVNTIVLQAISEANLRKAPATIAVVDRVGNVLTVTQMAGAPTSATVTSNRGIVGGLEGAVVPTTLAAISKAVTGAYLSSDGNAFSTRTANQIIQEHFDPGVRDAQGGPLFGVQFSQLACSDFITPGSATPGATSPGPHAAPLGFSADSGGLPIYKNGVLVGGIGVMTKSTYSLDLNILDVDNDNDEVIALAGEYNGFEAPQAIRADNITVGGNSLRYTDVTDADLAQPITTTGTFTPIVVPGFFAGPAAGQTAIAGLTYASTDGASGIVPDGTFGAKLFPGTTAYVFTDGAGNVLDAPKAGLAPTDGSAITASEAQALLTSALNVAESARAQIRIPSNSFAQVTATVVDIDGNVLAQARTPDAPIFGSDVSRQKARTAAFFSRTDAAAKINAITAPASTDPGTFADYITRSDALVGPNTFANGIAWSEVGIGAVARPFYPDGIDGSAPGSLSLPFATHWSVFSTGLQTDLIASDVVNVVAAVSAGKAPTKPAVGCANINGAGLPAMSGGKTQLANGLQIFSGSVPIYRGSELVGGLGVSGDGIQQDSLISFFGLQSGPGTIANAPAAIRNDQLIVQGTSLRYTNCPAAPFLNSHVQNPC